MKIDKKTKLLYPLIILGVFFLISSILFFSNSKDKNVKDFNDYEELRSGEKLPISFGSNLGFPPGWTMPNYDFEGDFPKIPEKMMIFKVIPPKLLSETDIRQIGHKYFGISSDAFFDPGIAFCTLITNTHILNISQKTGFLSFDLRSKKNEEHSTNRDDYPDDDECKQIAIKFLKEKGLFEKDTAEPRVTEQMKLSGFINVGFDSLIGGYKTYGIGRRLRVGVGPEGEIKYVQKQWINVEPWKFAPIKTPQEAFNELKNGKAFFADIGVSKIDEITIRYFTQEFQRGYIAPVYYFSLKKAGGTCIVVPAVRSEYIMPDTQMIELNKEKE